MRSQGGDEVGGDVQKAPVNRPVWCGIGYRRVSCPLPVSVCLSFLLRLSPFDNQLLDSRASDSQVVVRAPSPWEGSNAGQSSTGVKVKSLFLSLPSLVGGT